jgi:Tfp pilus assembly protein PilN
MTALKIARRPQPTSMLEGVPPRAQVNLLPTEIVTARGVRGLQRKLVYAVLGFVALIAIVVVFTSMRVDNAQSDLEAEQQRTSQLLVEQSKYIEVTAVKARLVTSQAALLYASSTEVRWADYLALVAGATPEGVLITSLTAQTADPTAGAAVVTDPLETEGLGLLTIGATSTTRPDVTAWSRSLNRVPGFADARILVSSQDDSDGELRFETTVTVRVLPTALSSSAGMEGTG